MNRSVLILSGLVTLVAACSPSKYSVAVELSSPSKSGISLVGKTVSVAYRNNGDSEDSLFLARTADSFIEVLEDEYFDGEESVPLFKVDAAVDEDVTAKDGMVDLIMATGTDLAFLFDVAPSEGGVVTSELKLYAYDSLNPADTVRLYTGKVTLGKWDAALYGQVVGQKSADIFSPQWTREYISFYYFSSDKWNEAVEDASQYKFREAADIWLSLVQSKDTYKAACAQYNIAAVCYIFGQYPLALKWLDMADKNYSIPETAVLRKKVKSRQ